MGLVAIVGRRVALASAAAGLSGAGGRPPGPTFDRIGRWQIDGRTVARGASRVRRMAGSRGGHEPEVSLVRQPCANRAGRCPRWAVGGRDAAHANSATWPLVARLSLWRDRAAGCATGGLSGGWAPARGVLLPPGHWRRERRADRHLGAGSRSRPVGCRQSHSWAADGGSRASARAGDLVARGLGNSVSCMPGLPALGGVVRHQAERSSDVAADHRCARRALAARAGLLRGALALQRRGAAQRAAMPPTAPRGIAPGEVKRPLARPC